MCLIEVEKISTDGSTFVGESVGGIPQLKEDPYFGTIGPIRYRLFAECVSKELVVRGTVDADLERACSRCAEFFSTSVSDSSFLRAYDVSNDVRVVDTKPDLREAILLHIPTFLKCKPGCLGLCPQCGENLNVGPCSCPLPPGDIRWNELDRLLPD